jgi:hypothetical protein
MPILTNLPIKLVLIKKFNKNEFKNLEHRFKEIDTVLLIN